MRAASASDSPSGERSSEFCSSSERDLPLILNPFAGRGRAGRQVRALLPRLVERGWRPRVLRSRAPGHAEELARELHACDRVAVAGGDGTVWEVVNGLAARGLPLPDIGLIPAGTGDALARDLGLTEPEVVLTALVGDRPRFLDLARVDLDGRDRVAFSVVGWGAFARINRGAERLRAFGPRRYEVAALLELARPRLAGSGASWGRPPRGADALLAVACLTRHTGRGMCLAPDARLDDGTATLVVIDRGPRARLLALLRRVHAGAHIGSPLVRVERIERLEVELDPGSWVVLDGEALPARRLTLRVDRRALPVLVADDPPDPASSGDRR